jgi:peptidyl-prolyl cis-trans isomerase D
VASRAKDGDLGWLSRGLMVTPFEEAMFSLKPGEVSGVVRTSFGYHVVRVDQIDPGIVPPFEAAKDVAKQRLAASELAQLKRQAMAKFPVKIHREVLEASGK